MNVRRVLALNAGSSSVKAALFDGGKEVGRAHCDRDPDDDSGLALQALLDRLHIGSDQPDVVGHRIVHGGARGVGPRLVDSDVTSELHDLVSLAPLHQEAGLALLAAARARYPAVPHVACFDTAFHRAMPEAAQRLAIADEWWDAGVRRYGFHGLSYDYVRGSLPAARRGRVVIAHLGSGCSMAALHDGVPRDTTMGLTPTGGLVMATRSGDLDPGVLLYMLRARESTAGSGSGAGAADLLERAVDSESGLLGVSATTGDMRVLLDRRVDDPRAELAIEVFCRSARKHIGAMAAALGGLDVLVFTGGIGASSHEIRGEVCAGLEHLGIGLDQRRNEAGSDDISAPDANCRTLVVTTDEELVIARQVATLLGADVVADADGA